jgi:hypothetical protein
MKHAWHPDKVQWTRFVRLSHLKSLFNEGWDDHLRVDSRIFIKTYAKIQEITSWKLKAVEDTNAIAGEAETYMKELRDVARLDIGSIKRIPDDSEAKARQTLADSSLSFSLDISIPSGDLNEDAADAMVRKLEKRKREITVEISKLQKAIDELGQIKQARQELARFFATRGDDVH